MFQIYTKCLALIFQNVRNNSYAMPCKQISTGVHCIILSLIKTSTFPAPKTFLPDYWKHYDDDDDDYYKYSRISSDFQFHLALM